MNREILNKTDKAEDGSRRYWSVRLDTYLSYNPEPYLPLEVDCLDFNFAEGGGHEDDESEPGDCTIIDKAVTIQQIADGLQATFVGADGSETWCVCRHNVYRDRRGSDGSDVRIVARLGDAVGSWEERDGIPVNKATRRLAKRGCGHSGKCLYHEVFWQMCYQVARRLIDSISAMPGRKSVALYATRQGNHDVTGVVDGDVWGDESVSKPSMQWAIAEAISTHNFGGWLAVRCFAQTEMSGGPAGRVYIASLHDGKWSPASADRITPEEHGLGDDDVAISEWPADKSALTA